MISILTASGSKNLILRGVMTPDGAKAIAAGSITAPGPADRQFWDGTLASLSVTIDPPQALGGAASPIGVTIPTNAVLASATGGSPPYTCAWTIDSDDGLTPDWNISSPSTAGTNFYVADVEPGVVRTAVMKATMTDSRGATGEMTVPAQVENYGSI